MSDLKLSAPIQSTGLAENRNGAIIPRSSEVTSTLLSRLDEGIHSIDLRGHSLDAGALSRLKGTFAVMFGGLAGGDVGKTMLLWQHLLNKQWSQEHLDATLYKFQETFKQYGTTWQMADFFACSPESDLHDQAWYLEQSESDRANRIETFQAPGGGLLYRFIGAGVDLPDEFKRVWPK